MTESDFSALEDMIYSGRGIVLGMTEDGKPMIGYTLTGRSPSSQARELVYDHKSNTLRTVPTEMEKIDPRFAALLTYPVMTFIPELNTAVVSNGVQTELLYSYVRTHTDNTDISSIMREALCRPIDMYDAANQRYIDITSYEPDDPNFTPRISGVIRGNEAGFSVISNKDGKKSPARYIRELEPGKGFLITTYNGGNEKPLLPFTREPVEVTIGEQRREADDLSGSLVSDLYSAIGGNRSKENSYAVSAAVIILDTIPEIAIMNR
ncbi:hypothetical protein H6503_04385 [Candidatus Woesearchaeota archaeon]|nr:hypothetical protein [Candidatus Woesearchaeota archaeon]